MTSKNDITGDLIKSKNSNQAYADGWDRIFGNKKKDINIAEPQAQSTSKSDTIGEHHGKLSSDRVSHLTGTGQDKAENTGES